MTEYQSVFRNAQGEAAYMAAYDRALEKWPVPYEAKYVPTAYGDTHIIISGPEDGEPLILIHGMGDNATHWSVNIAALAHTYRVHALDIIGYVGKSKPVKVFSDRAELAEWLTDVLDALNIEKAQMAGYSLGGFLTISYALVKPERLKKIVLLAPAATLAPFSKEWDFRGTLPFVVGELAYDIYEVSRSSAYTMDMMRQLALNVSKEELAEGIQDKDLAELMLIFREESVEELRERIYSVLKNAVEFMFAPGNFVENESTELMWPLLLGKEHGKSLPPRFGPYPLPDEDLKTLKLPTLLLIGDHEVIYEADRAIKRAEELVENIQTVLIPNASHMVNYEQTELVNSHILNFLSGDK